LPALLFGQAFLERRHGSSALTDLIEELPVGDATHALGVDEARGRGVIHGRVGTISLSSFAVALDAFIEIDGTSGVEGRGRRLDGILAKLGFVGDFPLAVLIDRDRDRNANQGEERSEKEFAQAESVLRVSGHRQGKIFAYGDGRLKKEMFLLTRSAQGTLRAEDRRRPRAKLSAAEDEPEKLGVEEEDGGGDDPGNDGGEAGVGELAHFVAVAGELN